MSKQNLFLTVSASVVESAEMRRMVQLIMPLFLLAVLRLGPNSCDEKSQMRHDREPLCSASSVDESSRSSNVQDVRNAGLRYNLLTSDDEEHNASRMGA